MNTMILRWILLVIGFHSRHGVVVGTFGLLDEKLGRLFEPKFFDHKHATFKAVASPDPEPKRCRKDIFLVPHDSSKRTDLPRIPTIATRPYFLRSITLLPATLLATFRSNIAAARGLVKFPCVAGLGNTYHFMRAGQSLLESEDILSTNPLFLTNQEAALSDSGIEQVEKTCRLLNEADVNPTIVRYSIAANSVGSANIVGKELRIGRDRLVPEFNLMDPRAVGRWDMLSLKLTEAAVWAMDVDEAGIDGTGGRPPPNEDGTPNETLANQVTRLTNLLSVLETLYSGDTVLLIFPDGTGPALLSALIAGIPLNRVHELNFSPGEVRLDISVESVQKIMLEPTSENYDETIRRGRVELLTLRRNPDEIISLKDIKLEKERIAIEEDLAKKRAEQEAARAEEETMRMARQRPITKVNTGEGADLLGDDSKRILFIGAAFGSAALLGGSTFLTDSDTEKGTTNFISPVTSSSITFQNQTIGIDISEEQIWADLNESKASLNNLSSRDRDDVGNAAGTMVDNSSADRSEKAEKAMDIYFSQDDGGDAWISLLSEMMEENNETSTSQSID